MAQNWNKKYQEAIHTPVQVVVETHHLLSSSQEQQHWLRLRAHVAEQPASCSSYMQVLKEERK